MAICKLDEVVEDLIHAGEVQYRVIFLHSAVLNLRKDFDAGHYNQLIPSRESVQRAHDTFIYCNKPNMAESLMRSYEFIASEIKKSAPVTVAG